MPLEQHPRQLVDARRGSAATQRGLPSRLCALVALAGLIITLPLASATLPDSLWIGGIYDGGDVDDLIVMSADVMPATSSPVGRQLAIDPEPHVLVVANGFSALSEVPRPPPAVEKGNSPTSRTRPDNPTQISSSHPLKANPEMQVGRIVSLKGTAEVNELEVPL